MKAQLSKIAFGVALAFATSASNAAQVDFGENIFIELGVSLVGDSATRTNDFTELNWGGTANSIYDISGGADPSKLDAGDKVWDASTTSIQGFTDQKPGTTDPASNLNFLQSEGYGLWQLNYEYVFEGTTLGVDANGVPTGANFTDGFFNIYFDDIATTVPSLAAHNGKQLLALDVEGFSVAFPGNGTEVSIFVTGTVNYDFLGAPDTFVENFFNFSKDDLKFYDAWLAGTPLPTITFRIDTNLTDNGVVPTNVNADALVKIDPSMVLAGVDENLFRGNTSNWGQSVSGCVNAGASCDADPNLVVRSTAITPSLRFERIPEPGTIALLGLGLLGLVGSLRRKVQA